MKTNKPKFETLAIKLTENKFTDSKPVSVPIYLSSTYVRNFDGSYQNDFVYSRVSNPNRTILENSIAKLEKGKYCYAFSSGMAAINAFIQSLKSGDHILLSDDCYFAVKELLTTVFNQWNLSFDLVDTTNLKAIENAILPNTAAIWVESPSNPMLKISNIKKISELAHQNNALCVVDNTWLTPVFQNPLQLGADVVIHSTTKYFGGHSDVLGGCIVVNNETLATKISAIQKLSGATPSPFDCYLLTRGIQTLHLRISKQTENAFLLAQFLANHPKIEQVFYPGLKNHKQHVLAKEQQKGFGAMLSVLIKGTSNNAVNVANKLQYFTTATSLGGVESLIEHRKSVEGITSLTPDNLLRISVGIEHIDDLIEDWKQALNF